jgi:NAD(P)H-flavin reductase
VCQEALTNPFLPIHRPQMARRGKLYYGIKTAKHLAYKDKLKLWEARGLTVAPCFSQTPVPLAFNPGYSGYVQVRGGCMCWPVLLKRRPYCKLRIASIGHLMTALTLQQAVAGDDLRNPDKTAALLCGMKEMTMLVTKVLTDKGVDPARILLNF